MNHGGSQNLMIKVEKEGKALGDIKANSKVVYPDGKESSKMLNLMHKCVYIATERTHLAHWSRHKYIHSGRLSA